MCQANTNQTFYDECVNATASPQKWIILNKFDKNYSNEILDDINSTSSEFATGLIFQTTNRITTDHVVEYPAIISEDLTYANTPELANFSYNVQPGYRALYKHTFIAHCEVVNYVWPTYYIYGGLWGAIMITFTVWLYCMPESERFSLQKSLIMLPLLKCFEAFLEGGYLHYCPFYSTTSNGV